MLRPCKTLLATALICATTLYHTAVATAADIPKLTGPVLFTSLGQSPDVKTLAVLAKRAKFEGESILLATAADVAKYKTLLITVGTSLKGFGSAGVNLDTETKRCEEMLKSAKDNGVYVVLVHIGGEGRRDSMTNLLLEKLAPSADAFMVYASGNGDGWFNNIAGEKPLVLVPKTLDLVKELEKIKP